MTITRRELHYHPAYETAKDRQRSAARAEQERLLSVTSRDTGGRRILPTVTIAGASIAAGRLL